MVEIPQISFPRFSTPIRVNLSKGNREWPFKVAMAGGDIWEDFTHSIFPSNFATLPLQKKTIYLSFPLFSSPSAHFCKINPSFSILFSFHDPVACHISKSSPWIRSSSIRGVLGGPLGGKNAIICSFILKCLTFLTKDTNIVLNVWVLNEVGLFSWNLCFGIGQEWKWVVTLGLQRLCNRDYVLPCWGY